MVLSFRYCLRSAITLARAASGHAAAAEPLPGHLLKSQQVLVCALTTGCFLYRLVFPFHLCHSEAGGKAISVSLCLSCLAERERPILLRGRLPELSSSLPPSLPCFIPLSLNGQVHSLCLFSLSWNSSSSTINVGSLLVCRVRRFLVHCVLVRWWACAWPSDCRSLKSHTDGSLETERQEDWGRLC